MNPLVLVLGGAVALLVGLNKMLTKPEILATNKEEAQTVPKPEPEKGVAESEIEQDTIPDDSNIAD